MFQICKLFHVNYSNKNDENVPECSTFWVSSTPINYTLKAKDLNVTVVKKSALHAKCFNQYNMELFNYFVKNKEKLHCKKGTQDLFNVLIWFLRVFVNRYK